tara:strand:- start:94 stop:315 length:222 start_codon:yes stop_codon:yes gene_type:complete
VSYCCGEDRLHAAPAAHAASDGILEKGKGKGKRDLEAILILLGVGLALFIPVGSVLGFRAWNTLVLALRSSIG